MIDVRKLPDTFPARCEGNCGRLAGLAIKSAQTDPDNLGDAELFICRACAHLLSKALLT